MGVDTHPSDRCWLVKSEPQDYGFDDLMRDGRTPWEGVRNYQARNFMRDAMRPGDPVLFYHSSTTVPAVVGVAEVASPSRPDPSQFDPSSGAFDAAATELEPRWFLVDLRGVRAFERAVSLAELKTVPSLADMRLLQRGNRLSVMPVEPEAFAIIVALARRPAPPVPSRKQ